MNAKDTNFDQEIIDLFSEVIPLEDDLPVINPWSKPIGFITWGFILTTIHLNFLYLQYILPTVGVVLIFLGFRSLRDENKYFKIAWILSIFRLLYHLADLVRISTPLNDGEFPELNVGLAMLMVQITMFLLYHGALKMVYKKADKVMEGNPLIWISWWTAVVALITRSSASSSWFVAIPMMICYVGITYSLYHIGDCLDDARYFMVNAPVKISNRRFGWSYMLTALTIAIFCSAFFSHLKLEAKEYHVPIIIEDRQHLVAMGFPSDALLQLSNEDVLLLSEAVNIEVFSKVLMFDPIEVRHEDTSEGYTQITHTNEPGRKNLESTTIYIEMPKNVVYVMQYFIWKGGQPVWQDGINIPIALNTKDLQLISSDLFYAKKQRQYRADFPRLVSEEVTFNSMFGSEKHIAITGALSYPFGSKDQGGYILYRNTVLSDSEIYFTYAILNYLHNENPSFIPYEKAEDVILNGGYNSDNMFQQHYTVYDSLALKEIEE